MLRRNVGRVFVAILMLLPLSLQAVPLFVSGDSGVRGDTVQVGLTDEQTDMFETATIEVLYDPNYLAFTAASLGDLIDDAALAFTLVLDDTAKATGNIVVSLASGSSAIDMMSGELLRITFEILASAPFGDTTVSFQCQNPTATQADSCLLDYNIPRTSGIVTVVPSSTSVPVPSSLLLVALGLLVIPVIRR